MGSLRIFQNKYVSTRDDRVGYVTGIPGLIGIIVIQETLAVVWVGGRYYSHVVERLDKATWTVKKIEEHPNFIEWLLSTLPEKSTIGIDPTLILASKFLHYKDAFTTNGHQFETIKQNLVDLVWYTKPELRIKDLEIIPPEFAGINLEAPSKCDKIH